MFRLIRIAFSLGCLAAFAWFGTQVKLGELTLYEHVKAIGDSPASQELIKGAKAKVAEGFGGSPPVEKNPPPPREVGKGKAAKPAEKAMAAGDKPPSDSVTEEDRKGLRKLLESRR